MGTPLVQLTLNGYLHMSGVFKMRMQYLYCLNPSAPESGVSCRCIDSQTDKDDTRTYIHTYIYT